MNFFQFHIGDWLSGTSLLTKVEKAIYLEPVSYTHLDVYKRQDRTKPKTAATAKKAKVALLK